MTDPKLPSIEVSGEKEWPAMVQDSSGANYDDDWRRMTLPDLCALVSALDDAGKREVAKALGKRFVSGDQVYREFIPDYVEPEYPLEVGDPAIGFDRGDGVAGLTVDPAMIKRRMDLDSAIVETAERYVDLIGENLTGAIEAGEALIQAVEAKRSATSSPQAERSGRTPKP